MKYLVKTKNDYGAVRIDNIPILGDKRKFNYLVLDEKNRVLKVDKPWLISHKDDLTNVRVSNGSLSLKYEREKVCYDGFKQKNETILLLPLTIFENVQKYLSIIFNNLGLLDVVVTSETDLLSKSFSNSTSTFFNIEALENPFKFDMGCLSISMSISYDFTEFGCELYIIFQLCHVLMGEKFVTEVKSMLTDTFRYKICDLKLLNPDDYAVEKKYDFVRNCENGLLKKKEIGYDNSDFLNKYPGFFCVSPSWYSSKSNSIYVDSSEIEKIKNGLKKPLMHFVKSNKEVLKKYLYRSKNYKDISSLYRIVDKADTLYKIYAPSGKKTVERAYQLEAQGYKIIVDNIETTAKLFDSKCLKITRISRPYFQIGFEDVSEYVDEINKIFYVKLGRVVRISKNYF